MKAWLVSATISVFLSGSAYSECPVGLDGEKNANPFSVSKLDDGRYYVELDNDEGNAFIGLFMTDKDAVLPVGPFGKLTGTDYWSIGTERFPKTFSLPVAYQDIPEGAVENTADYGGIQGGSSLDAIPAGECLKFSIVQFPSFKETAFYVVHE